MNNTLPTDDLKKYGIINEVDKAVHIHDGILHGGGREQNLEGVAHCIPQGGGLARNPSETF